MARRGAPREGRCREDLLCLCALDGAIAAATHLAGHDGGAERLLGAPVRGVERSLEEEAEDRIVFAHQMALKSADRHPPAGRARQELTEALEILSAGDGEAMRRDGSRAA